MRVTSVSLVAAFLPFLVNMQKINHTETLAKAANLTLLTRFQVNYKGETEWIFNEECRLQENNPDEWSRKPGTSWCFGQPIMYNHTINPSLKFPANLEFVRGFPHCWNELEPLLCGLYYRPSDVIYFEPYAKPGTLTLIKVHQVFPQSWCLKVRKACDFLVERDLWPDEINCEDVMSRHGLMEKKNHSFFNLDKRCHLPYNYTTKPSTSCISPLVYANSNGSSLAVPIRDQCFVPCSSSFSRNSNRPLYLRYTIFVLNAVFGSGFLYCAVYSIEAWPLLFASLYGITYHLIWIVSMLLQLSADMLPPTCTLLDNVSVRAENQSFFSWCSIQSFALSFCLLNTYSWLAIWSVFGRMASKQFEFWKKCFVEMSKFFGIVLMELSIGAVAIWNSPGQHDGFTGTCSSLLNPIGKNLVLYFILFLSLLPILFNFVKQPKTEHEMNTSYDPLLTSAGGNRQNPASKQQMLWTHKVASHRMFRTIGIITLVLSPVVLHCFFQYNPELERLSLEMLEECNLMEASFFSYIHLLAYLSSTFGLLILVFVAVRRLKTKITSIKKYQLPAESTYSDDMDDRFRTCDNFPALSTEILDSVSQPCVRPMEADILTCLRGVPLPRKLNLRPADGSTTKHNALHNDDSGVVRNILNQFPPYPANEDSTSGSSTNDSNVASSNMTATSFGVTTETASSSDSRFLAKRYFVINCLYNTAGQLGFEPTHFIQRGLDQFDKLFPAFVSRYFGFENISNTPARLMIDVANEFVYRGYLYELWNFMRSTIIANIDTSDLPILQQPGKTQSLNRYQEDVVDQQLATLLYHILMQQQNSVQTVQNQQDQPEQMEE